MKKKLYLYCCKTGDIKAYGEKSTQFDNLSDWVELELSVEIPPDIFEKPKLKYEIGVAEKRKEFSTITKSSSTLGLAELRSAPVDEQPIEPAR